MQNTRIDPRPFYESLREHVRHVRVAQPLLDSHDDPRKP
jgi:hypothetical protein